MLPFTTLFGTLYLLVPFLGMVSAQNQPDFHIFANSGDQTTFRVNGGIEDYTQFEIHYTPITGDLKKWERFAITSSGEKKKFPAGEAKWQVHVPGFEKIVECWLERSVDIVPYDTPKKTFRFANKPNDNYLDKCYAQGDPVWVVCENPAADCNAHGGAW